MKETTKEIIGAISFLLIGVVFLIGIMILVMQDANNKSKDYDYCNKTNFTMINEDINCSEYKDWKGINAEAQRSDKNES